MQLTRELYYASNSFIGGMLKDCNYNRTISPLDATLDILEIENISQNEPPPPKPKFKRNNIQTKTEIFLADTLIKAESHFAHKNIHSISRIKTEQGYLVIAEIELP